MTKLRQAVRNDGATVKDRQQQNRRKGPTWSQRKRLNARFLSSFALEP